MKKASAISPFFMSWLIIAQNKHAWKFRYATAHRAVDRQMQTRCGPQRTAVPTKVHIQAVPILPATYLVTRQWNAINHIWSTVHEIINMIRRVLLNEAYLQFACKFSNTAAKIFNWQKKQINVLLFAHFFKLVQKPMNLQNYHKPLSLFLQFD